LRTVRLLPFALLAAGVAALGLAVACGGGEKASPSPTQDASPGATSTSTSTRTPTPRPTETPTPIPTPTPYNGKVMALRIPKLNVNAPIEELAINSRGELDTPKAENTAVGWYYIYDKPGRLNPENRGWIDWGGKKAVEGFYGNAVFSAHVYYHSIPAPFQRLTQLTDGDEVIITMEDGREYTYRVISKARYHRDTIDMGRIIWPPDKPDDQEWITLITCGGELDSTGLEYVSRDVVIAMRLP
jgi:sortase (surface protein transpeptidase)